MAWRQLTSIACLMAFRLRSGNFSRAAVVRWKMSLLYSAVSTCAAIAFCSSGESCGVGGVVGWQEDFGAEVILGAF